MTIAVVNRGSAMHLYEQLIKRIPLARMLSAISRDEESWKKDAGGWATNMSPLVTDFWKQNCVD
jgi:hypothetical protein